MIDHNRLDDCTRQPSHKIYAPIFRILRIIIIITITNSLMRISNWIVTSGDDIVRTQVKKREGDVIDRLGVKRFGIQFFI